MFAQSEPWPDSIAVARDLADAGRVRLGDAEQRERGAERASHRARSACADIFPTVLQLVLARRAQADAGDLHARARHDAGGSDAHAVRRRPAAESRSRRRRSACKTIQFQSARAAATTSLHDARLALDYRARRVVMLIASLATREHTMQLAMIGLGRMGGNMVERLMRNGHKLVVYDRSAEAVAKYEKLGATPAKDLDGVVVVARGAEASSGSWCRPAIRSTRPSPTLRPMLSAGRHHHRRRQLELPRHHSPRRRSSRSRRSSSSTPARAAASGDWRTATA